MLPTFRIFSRSVAPATGLFCFLVALIAFIIASPLLARPITPNDIDALVSTALAKWEVPGCAVAIVQNGQVIYLKGHGRRSLTQVEPVTVDTVFPLASCTKAFTTTLIGQLVDDGTMQWDDPVRKHWPEFKLNEAWANEGVTIRDLLCHRTGLASHDFLWYRAPWPMTEIVRRAGSLPLHRPFRTEFQYQSVMVSAAGLAAGRAGGSSWDKLLRTRLLEPLGMSATHVTTPTVLDRAVPHGTDGAGRLVIVPEYEVREPNPAGSIYAPIRDVAQWMLFQLGDGTHHGRRLITAERLRDTHTPQMVQRFEGLVAAAHSETTMMSYGMGWVIQDYRGQLLWSHTGVIDGFRAQIALAPKQGLGIAVLSNRHETRMNLALINIVLDQYLERGQRDWHQHFQDLLRQEARADQERWRQRDRLRQNIPRPMALFAGRYHNEAYGTIELTADGDRMTFQWNAFRGPVRFHHGTTLEVDVPELKSPLIEFRFTDGRPTSFQLFDVDFRRQ